jgi:FKBP-type peptidyl-prolyl cis-trans isomerase FklB
MKNTMTKMATTSIAAGLLLLAGTIGAQTPASTAPQTPAPAAQPAPAVKPQKPPATSATKTGPASGAKTAVPLTLKTPKDKSSYSIGLNIGKGLHRDDVDVDPSIILRGLRDGLADRKPLMTDEEIKATMIALQTDVRKKQQAKMEMAANTNKQEGEAFLTANKTQDGVVTLPSGLQYKILKEGDGPKPAATDSVVCNYRGTLLNNTEFDSSYKRGQPATLNVSGVIKGWTEALQLMPVGSKWQLFVPSELAYGQRGAGGTIGPNATLIFEIELLSIQPKGVTKAPAAQPPPTQPPATP